MKSANPETLKPLTTREREALIILLGDEDPAVHQPVFERILACGAEACAWLQPHALSLDPLLRRRVRALLRRLRAAEMSARFEVFCKRQGQDIDLEEGVWLLALTRYPEVNVEAYRALLDNYAAAIRERIDPKSHPQAVVMAMNQHLFQRLRFAGNEEHYYDPDNSYLNRVLDERVGNPISLCTVYLLIARRLQLPVTGIGLPGHLVCRYQTSTYETYIDCFHTGRFLTRAACVQFALQSPEGLAQTSLAPMSARAMLLRMCRNLAHAYRQMSATEDLHKMQRYVALLEK